MVNTIKYRYNMTITKKDDLISREEVLEIAKRFRMYNYDGFIEEIKNLNTNHKLSERGMADASSSDESNKSANNDLCKCGHNKDIHSPLAQDICLIYLGNGYACDCKHFERSNIKNEP